MRFSLASSLLVAALAALAAVVSSAILGGPPSTGDSVQPEARSEDCAQLTLGTNLTNRVIAADDPSVVSAGERPAEESIASPVDSCRHLRDELAAAQAELAAQRVESDALRRKIAALERDLCWIQHPEETPFGAFLRSPEADGIPEPEIRTEIKEWLDEEFPLFLRPGEATWLAERMRRNDWKSFADTCELAILLFLGPSRVAAEVPPERLAQLKDDYAGEGLFGD